MSYSKKAPEVAHDLIMRLFDEKKGALNQLRKGCGLTDIDHFAKEEEIIKATDLYVRKIIDCWKSKYSNNAPTSYKFPSIDEKATDSLNPTINSQVQSTILNDMSKVDNNSDLKGSSSDLSNVQNEQSIKSSNNMSTNNLNQNPGSIPKSAPTPVVPNPKISFSLKNAKVGEPYSAELQIQGETENKKVVIHEILFPEGLGLSALEHDFKNISGSPQIDGEKKVFVRYQFKDAKPENPLLQGEFNLFINPDPKSLWLKKEPDSSLPYFKKHLDNNSIQTKENFIMAAASRRGRSHEHSGTFRDDDFLLATEHGWDILVVGLCAV